MRQRRRRTRNLLFEHTIIQLFILFFFYFILFSVTDGGGGGAGRPGSPRLGGGGGGGGGVSSGSSGRLTEDTLAYTVQNSDTLTSLPARFDTTPSELVAINKLHSRLIFPGQVSPSINNSKSLLHVLVAKRRERIRAHKFCTRLKSRRDAANGSRLVLQLFVL